MNIQVAQIMKSQIYDLISYKRLSYLNEQLELILARTEKSVWETKASDKLIDNISFHKSANKMMRVR
jgi:hypothetical protein